MDNKCYTLPNKNELDKLRDELILLHVDVIKKHIEKHPFGHQWKIKLPINSQVAEHVKDYITSFTNYDVTYSIDSYNSEATFILYEEGWKNIILKEKKEQERWMWVYSTICCIIVSACALVMYYFT